MPRREKSLLSANDLRIIRRETDKFFGNEAEELGIGFYSKWSAKAKKALQHRSKRQRRSAMNAISDEIRDFALGYWKTVGLAGGHLASLLAQALAFHAGLGPKQLEWIRKKVEEFDKRTRSTEDIRHALEFAIDPVSARDLPGFELMLSKVVAELTTMPPSIHSAEEQLELAVALMGKEKTSLIRLLHRPVVSLGELMKRSSCSQGEAAAALDVSARTIRAWADAGKLNRTRVGRIVCDEKLVALHKLRHSPAET